jgi:predicted transcriptional regulator
MTLVLELPVELERRLNAIAEHRREAQEAVAIRAISDGLEPAQLKPAKVESGADIVAAWRASGAIGAWNQRPDIGDSVEFAKELRKRSNQRISE